MIAASRPLLLLISLVLTTEALAQRRTPIFRYISIAPCGRLELDSAFVPRGRATQQDDSTFRLISQCFGGAEQILVHVTAAGRISSFEFAYGADTSLARHVAIFAADLGAPLRVDTIGPNPHRVLWRDSLTDFLVIRRPGNQQVFARLSNRAVSTSRP
jgi:hypothetical protein